MQKGNFADLVIFDPEKITDKATFKNPYQYSVGIKRYWSTAGSRFTKANSKSFSGKVLKREE